MKNYIQAIYVLLFIALTAGGCKKDNTTPSSPVSNSVTFKITYQVDGQVLRFDTLLYTNDAGNHYSVSRLWYYLSRIGLIKSDSSVVLLKDYQWLDGAAPVTNTFSISSVPEGNYIGVCFNIGLDSVQNRTNALPAYTYNLNMAWPDNMGGGYHFMMFEGHYADSSGTTGYTMHLGRNECLVKSRVYAPVTVGGGEQVVNLQMNLNEWFRGPEVYNFNIDGNHSMNNMAAMMKLSRNGMDVFSIQ